MKPVLPPLRLLAVFEIVLRRGGTRAASVELNISPSAVSQALRQLEEHVGTALLDRTTRPAGLTEAGRLLHRAVADGLGRITDAIEEIGRLGTGHHRSVTIACSVGIATYWLMPRLAGFYETHPDVVVNVRTTQRGDPPLSNGIDLAIRFGAGDWTDGQVHRLFQERIDPVCSPAYAARMAGVADLASATLIHVDVDDTRWMSWRAYQQAVGLPIGRNRPAIRFTNYVQATQAALSGHGVMLGWRSITGDLVAEERLVPAIDRPLVPSDAFHLVAGHSQPNADACRAVAAWLIAEGAQPSFRDGEAEPGIGAQPSLPERSDSASPLRSVRNEGS